MCQHQESYIEPLSSVLCGVEMDLRAVAFLLYSASVDGFSDDSEMRACLYSARRLIERDAACLSSAQLGAFSNDL